MNKEKIKAHSPTELTLGKLRTYKGFEDISEKDGLEAIGNIKSLSRVLYYYHLEDSDVTVDKDHLFFMPNT